MARAAAFTLRKWEMKPEEIERRSFEIIHAKCMELGIDVPEDKRSVVYRVIHAPADFDYARTLVFSDEALDHFAAAVRAGCDLVTDTNMALSGIDKRRLSEHGCEAFCFMADDEVARVAKMRGETRALVSMEKAARLWEKRRRPMVFAIGNAPTALLCLCSLMDQGFSPAFVVAAPVGFVQVVEAKEAITKRDVPYIAAMGQKGGSGVAAAIVNGLLRVV